MPRLRLASYNIAWFSRLFDRDNRLAADLEWSALRNVTRQRQAEAIAEVLRRVDAVCYALVEAPNSGHRRSCVTELENFAAYFGLRQRAAVIGFENPTHQEIALLFDPDRIAARHAPIGEMLSPEAARGDPLPFGVPRFDSVFPADLDGTGEIILHRFSKPPLEAVIKDRASGMSFRLIVVHLKSKAPHGAATPTDLRRRELENRDKQYAQAAWLRARLDGHMMAGDEVIVLGDFNDGPGHDHLEQATGRSSVEMVMGDPARPEARMVSPLAAAPTEGAGAGPASARFLDDSTGRQVDALIDFIMLSPGLAGRSIPAWRIWNPFNDAECAADPSLRAALEDASDHFPVTIDLDMGHARAGAGAPPV